MSEEKISCRFTKVKNNKLLSRVQMIVDVFHSPQVKVTKNMIAEEVKRKFKKNHISIFGLKKLFGGGRTQAFALVYDTEDAMKKIEPPSRLRKIELAKMTPEERKNAPKPKKEGRKVLKVKKNQNARKRATQRRRDLNLQRKQNKKK